ncbi:hypothetical protein PoB_001291400 [Plakobranchus ocellatus]|uniref:Uncharacterized protein n=1 Tax=Plakobranchus ocellatus TaxID=259542 RepID=A0AAV3YXG4_9GAST|nr:hypothetical protein PoB_001291400 [Plakobranchus ocellatus]
MVVRCSWGWRQGTYLDGCDAGCHLLPETLVRQHVCCGWVNFFCFCTIDGRAMLKKLEASKTFNTESRRRCPLTALATAFPESMYTSASGAYITSRSSRSPDPVIRLPIVPR